MHQFTDEVIAFRVQKGDAESFGVLVERYEAKLLRYGRKFLSNGADVEDLVQEVFIKSYVNIKSFDPGLKFSPWIYRIAHNVFVNAVRSKVRMPVFSFDLDLIFPQPIAPETADEEAHRAHTRKMLDECLDKIDPKYRETLVLYFYEDMSYKEIAEVLQIPVSTVGVRIARGKTVLKNILKDHDGII